MKSNKGSALLVAILLSAILLAALGGLLTVALNEYRGSLKSYFNTAAFSLAESGVDRAAAAIKDGFLSATDVTVWPSTESATAPAEWYKKTVGTTTTYRGYFPIEDLEKGRKGVCAVIVRENSPTSFDVYARGVVYVEINGETTAARALHVKLTKTSNSSAGSGYALAAIKSLSLATSHAPAFKGGEGAKFARIASYDSNIGSPHLWTDMTAVDTSGTMKGDNVDDDVMIGVTSGSMDLQNALIYGKVAVAKGAEITPHIFNIKRQDLYGDGVAKKDQFIDIPSAVLVNLDIASDPKNASHQIYRGYNLGGDGNPMAAYDDTKADYEAKGASSCILKNYTFPAETFSTPELSKLDGYGTGKTSLKGAAITQSDAEVNLDGTSDSYYKIDKLVNVSTINVKGTVLLHLQSQLQTNGGDGLTIKYADSSSKLVIYAESTVDIKMKNCPKYTIKRKDPSGNDIEEIKEIAPKQFEINVVNGGTVQIKCDTGGVFAGIVKAPGSKVSISASGSGDNMRVGYVSAALQMAGRSQLRGQIIAESIDMSGSNNLDILYDVQTKGGKTVKDNITVSSWKQTLVSDFAAQL